MITRDEVMPLLVAACPSFRASWEAHVVDFEERLLYVDLGKLAHHLVALQDADELRAVFAVVERLHAEGDAPVQEAATIGLLEGIQNIAGTDAARFVPLLGPRSAKAWRQLNAFWSGGLS